MQRSIESTGQVITVLKVFRNAGKFEGEICDLYQYKDTDNTTKLIESPLLAK